MAYKMKGSPAKLGTIQGTTGHSSALKQQKSIFKIENEKRQKEKEEKAKRDKKIEDKKKMIEREKRDVRPDPNLPNPTFGNSPAKQKKSETIERIKKEMDPKVREALNSFDRPTPGIKTKKPSKEQVKKILEKMKSIKGLGVQLSDDHKKTIEGFEKMIKDQKSPAKQEGPVDKKQLPLQEGEMEGTAVYNPSEDKTMSKSFVNRERIADLEDRAEYARSDAESAEGEEKKRHLANAKKLQQEADILRNRKPNKK